MRHSYVITYDIACPRRWRQVFRTLRGYGDHLQLSVFCCDLSDAERQQLKSKLELHIDPTADQVLWVDMGPRNSRAQRALSVQGRPASRPEPVALIV